MSSSAFLRTILHLVAFLNLFQYALGHFDVFRIDLSTYDPQWNRRHARDIPSNVTVTGEPFNGNFAEVLAAAGLYKDSFWIVLPHNWHCSQVLDARLVNDKKDVSGRNVGVRCRGDGCISDHSTDNIDLIEMHWSNTPLYHWTLYKDRLDDDKHQIMWGVDGEKYGACEKIGTPTHWTQCYDRPPFMGNTKTFFVHPKFKCWDAYDWTQINAAP
ncbi:hypothetical protein DPSP01_002208 [Paraphaeosphaeria sporulosa]